METKFADFNSVNTESNYDYQMFQTKDRLVFLGKWTFGLPTPTGAMPEVPQFVVEPDADQRRRDDTASANVLLGIAPVKCHGVFHAARANGIYMLKEAHRLAGLGYGQIPLIDKMRGDVTKSIKELDLLGAQLWAIKVKCDDAERKCQTKFPDTKESEIEQTMYDLAIVQRIGTIEKYEQRMMDDGDVPPRFNDTRLIQAIYRVPSAASGIDVAIVDKVRKMFAVLAWPRTSAAIKTVREMVDQAGAAVCSAAMTSESLSGNPAGAAFANSGLTWLSQYRGGLSTSKHDFDLAKVVERFPQGMPNELVLPAVQDAD